MMSFEDSQGEGSPPLLRLNRDDIQLPKQDSQTNTGSFVDNRENADDSLMEFPADNTFFCSEQKTIDFNASHHFNNSKVVDQSALKAIEDIAERYQNTGREIKLRHLSRDCHYLLSRTGQLMIDSDDDPEYALAVDYSVRLGKMNN